VQHNQEKSKKCSRFVVKWTMFYFAQSKERTKRDKEEENGKEEG
jgi:hypothetical protein